MLIDPLNISSTPVAILSSLGLKTSVGISSDDPKKERNLSLEFYIVLSLYNNSKLVSRKIIDTLKPNSHKFYYIDEEIMKLNLKSKPDFCVLHRVPTTLMSLMKIPDFIELDEHPDFDMYRMVVQYTSKKNSMGSVIYETPPNFNQNKGDFLSFSNKIYLTNDVKNNLIFINYSTNRTFDSTANVSISIYNSSGLKLKTEDIKIKPFSFGSLNINNLKLKTKERLLTFTAIADNLSLIPLSLINCISNGGISIEHSHPPQAYIMAPWHIKTSIKKTAIDFLRQENA